MTHTEYTLKKPKSTTKKQSAPTAKTFLSKGGTENPDILYKRFYQPKVCPADRKCPVYLFFSPGTTNASKTKIE